MPKIQNILTFILLTTFVLFAKPTDSNSTLENNQTINLLQQSFKKNSRTLLKNISQKKFLKHFYRKNRYNPLWIVDNKLNEKKYSTLFKYIDEDITLSSKSKILMQYKNIQDSLENNLTTDTLLKIEIKLSSLYYNFLKHTLYGEIKWKNFSYRLSALKNSKINASWIRTKAPYKIEKLMIQENIDQTIEEITPKKFGYQGLLSSLAKLNELRINGGWKKLPSFKKLKIGKKSKYVTKLRSRLKISGDYEECNDDSNKLLANQENNLTIKDNELFGKCLDKAVKSFQQRHGLVVDGVVGSGTQKALNISVDKKIEKVLLNIDRIKWLPRDDNNQYIVVNIPEFMLHYIENKETKQKLRVIVGDRRHPTPIFSQFISFIVLNPYWKVPEGIVKREVVPAMIKDPSYLQKHGLEAHKNWNENSEVVDTSWLYWEDYLDDTMEFPYRLMQPPGPRNALGKIKFKFPNRFSVYLHDTPTKYLFKRTIRAFSHGCVRLSQPRELLKTIASFNKNINLKKARTILKGKQKTQLDMKNKLRIYLVYLTAGMNNEGKLEFRNDIYHYDKYTKRASN